MVKQITSPKAISSPTKVPEPEEDESSESDSEYVNQYSLIFPSTRNTQLDYDKYLEHSEKCYAKFTGSWSKNSKEEAAKALAEKEAKEAALKKPIVRYPFSPAKLKTPADTSSKVFDTDTRNENNPYVSSL